MKLRTKFSLIVGILVVLLLVVTAVILFVFEKRGLTEDVRVGQTVLAKNLSRVSRDCFLRKDNMFLINYLKTIKRNDDTIVYAFFTDGNNRVFAHTNPSFLGEMLKDAFGEKALRTQKLIYEKRTGSDGEKVLDYAVPVVLTGSVRGLARIGFSEDIVNKNISASMNKIGRRILIAAVVSFLVALAAIFLVSNSIVKPIRLLMCGAELIGKGKLDTKINLKSGDEFAALAEKFNDMSEKLKELDEMKRDFTSSVTHELRSPLGAIETYINKMLDGGIDGFKETGFSDLFIMKNNTARLSRFIDDLLDTAKIESGRMDVDAKFFKLLPVVNDVVELFVPAAKEKNVVIAVKIPKTLPDVYADKERIRQVFINLISNALKFTPSEGRVEISATYLLSGGDFVEISVKDTGMGIPPEGLKYIFDKFRQVKGEGKSVKGTGLGLFIVKSIIDLSGGSIEVKSAVGGGTQFSLTLPIKKR